MKILAHTFASPAENLACDEALLDLCEEGHPDEILRFWEPKTHFVVLGYSNRAATEVKLDACYTEGVPVHRRVSGGGTVLQGPGCLNYSLVLSLDGAAQHKTITSTNRFVMEKNRAMFEALLGEPVRVEGHTDLVAGGWKFSGNAQRRKKRFLLFHGTVLLHFDVALIEKYLAMPSLAPRYRAGRSHHDFVRNIDLSAETVKSALTKTWNAAGSLKIPDKKIASLTELYASEAWNLRF